MMNTFFYGLLNLYPLLGVIQPESKQKSTEQKR